MTEPLTHAPRTSTNGTDAPTSQPGETSDLPDRGGGELDDQHEVAPGTPLWVRAFGIVLVVLLLAFVGLHLTGTAPRHMGTPDGVQHSVQAP